MNNTPLNFRLSRKFLDVVLTEEDGITNTTYQLREMTAAERDNYLNRMQKRMKTDPSGKAIGVSNFDGMQADLLASCMTTVADSKPVTMGTIQAWPATVVTTLFEEAQKLNKLNRGEEEPVEAAKKD